jgi:hypothetical protein
MSRLFRWSSLIAAGSALIGVAACGRGNEPMDSDLKQDLAAVGAGTSVELAPRAGQSQLVVSPIEAGPTSAPVRMAHKPTAKPTQHSALRIAANVDPAPEPAPHPVVKQPAPSAPSRTAEPAPLPPVAKQPAQRQPGTYKTEGDIFRQMPWIRP